MAAPAKKPLQTYEDYLAEEEAASQPDLDDLEASDRLDAGGKHTINVPGGYDEPIPVEVFLELQRRFKGMKRGSPERNFGVVEGEFGGKKYRYDAYAGQEAAGYPRDRTVGAGANWSQRLLESFAGTHESNVQQRNVARNNQLRSRQLNADELYRQAMLESGAETRRGNRDLSRTRIREGSRTRALSRFLAAQPRAATVRTDAQEDRDRSAAELARAQAKAVNEGRGKSGTGGKEPKPDFTPDQAFTNMRQAETDVRDIESELNQIDEHANYHGIPFVPDWLESATGSGVHNPKNFDVELKDAKGQTYDTIPAAEVNQRRKDLIEARDFARQQVARFRDIVRNGGNGTQNPGTGDDDAAIVDEPIDEDMEPEVEGEPEPEAAGEGWDEASTVPAGDEAAAPTPMVPPKATAPAPTPEVNGKPRKKKPPPEILAKLPYKDQLYHEIADKNPGMSDAEIKRLVFTIIAKEATPPPRTAPGRGR